MFSVDVGPQYEGETVRKEDFHIEFGGPKHKFKAELVTVKPADQVEDEKVEIIGKDIKDFEEGASVPIFIKIDVAGEKLEKDNPSYRNVKKKLYEERGVLVGEISFTFDSLSTIRFFKFDNDSPYMYYASNPLSSETLVETNGIQGEKWMPMVFWKKDAREFYVKTKIATESHYRRGLLKRFRDWQAAQSKKK